MPDAWTARQLAQFAHLRDGFLKTGFDQDTAEAHAKRTIEQRPATRRRLIEEPTKDDLYREAKRYNITGRSKMDKEALAEAVAKHRSGARGH